MNPQLLIGLGGVLAAIMLAVYALAGTATEVPLMDPGDVDGAGGPMTLSTRANELNDPFRDRALAPILKGLTGLGRKYTPAGYVDGVRRKFTAMGNVAPEAVDRFLAIRVVTVVAIPLFWAFVLFGTHLSGMMRNAVMLLFTLALLLGPDAKINRKVEDRKRIVQRQLPEIMDLLVISVEAGLGFEQALDRTVHAVPGPLSEEFNRMLGETRAGSTRADALRAMEQRVHVQELRSFVLAILQADTFGVSIGRVLRAQADEMRIKRRQMAQERAMKAPIKMLVPMVFCIFPAIFVITLGPAVINILKNFK
jgi:tight adherence protein C